MFSAIARRYDLNNRLHSFGRDQAWRRRAVRLAAVMPEDRVLDVACGTGDLAFEFTRAGVSSVTAVDFTPEMLDLARQKARRHLFEGTSIEFAEGDALDLKYDDEAFTIVSIAFGIRNVTEPIRAIREFHRVLEPGGRIVILEFSEPTNPLLRGVNRLYCRHIMPWTASLIARDRSGAYRYLPKSVDSFLDRGEMAALLAGEGFDDVRITPLTFGVCCVYTGVRGRPAGSVGS